jgi:hypothetical protein
MNTEEISKWAITNIEPLLDSVTNSKLYRCSVTLKDGLFLPCVIIRNRSNWVDLAKKRFEECRQESTKGFLNKNKVQNLLTDYDAIVSTFVTSGNRIDSYNIAGISESKFAIPLERMKEFKGETSMSWTQFTCKMKDSKEFEFGTSFNDEFFDMPKGYCGKDIIKIVPAERGSLRTKSNVIFREKPFFECFLDALQ